MVRAARGGTRERRVRPGLSTSCWPRSFAQVVAFCQEHLRGKGRDAGGCRGDEAEQLLHHRPGALITMADDDPLFAVRNESSGKWRWRWRSPWGSVHVSPTLHSSAKNAMIAGRKWLEANT